MLVNRYGTREDFLVKFSPSYQYEIAFNQDVCYFGDYPTLAELKGYGDNTPKAWLVPQLYNLSEYCGSRDKLQGTPLEECATVIANEFYYLKVSEIMLFLYRFKAGQYGRFYSSIDPLIITTSLRSFLKERFFAYERHEFEENKRKLEEEKKNSVTWEDYCKIQEKKLREEGKNEEADTWVNRPFLSFSTTPTKQNNEAPKENTEDVVRIAKSLLNDPLADDDCKATFSRLFKKKYGYTPQEYIKKYSKDESESN